MKDSLVMQVTSEMNNAQLISTIPENPNIFDYLKEVQTLL